MRAPSMTAASLDPSEDDAIEDHSTRGADVLVHVTPRVTLLQMAPRSPDMRAASLQVATVVTADAALHALLAIA